MKIFISYATEDLGVAGSLFTELAGAGADVFQFGRTEAIGKPSWEQVLQAINDSEVFVVLISKSSIVSIPVRAEIDQAHYSYINRQRPGRLVVAMIDAVDPPITIERFTRLDLSSFETGITRLLEQLGLTRRTRVTRSLRKAVALPDLPALFEEYARTSPEPPPAAAWSKDVQRILSNYAIVAPQDLTGAERSHHIDAILAAWSGRPYDRTAAALNQRLRGVGAAAREESDADALPKLAALLASADPAELKRRVE